MRVTGVAVVTTKPLFSIYLWMVDDDTGTGGVSRVLRVVRMCGHMRYHVSSGRTVVPIIRSVCTSY